MTITVHAVTGVRVSGSVLWFLSGLTCTHQKMDKGEYRCAAADLGVAIVSPHTSPHGDPEPDNKVDWKFGSGRRSISTLR
jgi:S-formylglutathione hydrolase FrmB